jgi:hypothetical protein
MKQVVISLPVSPRLDAPLGFYLTAAAVGMMARLNHQEAVLAVNLIGARKHTSSEAEHYLTRAGAVCGRADHWIDSDADWKAILREVAERGYAEGWLTVREAEICHCDCGLLEYPAETPPDLDKRATGKVYERRADGLHCLHCGSRVQSIRLPSLYLTLPTVALMDVKPKWAESEIRTFAMEYAERAMLVSRRRQTGLTMSFGEYEFQLDPDLALMLLPFALHREGMAVSTIMTGNRTLKQAFMAAAVANRLGLPTPAIAALPMVTFTGEGGATVPTGDEVFATHDSHAIRAVLAMAMGNTPKEVKLPTRSLHLAATSLAMMYRNDVGGTDAVKETDAIASGLASLGKSKIETILAMLRRGQPLSSDQASVLKAICA